MDNASDVETNKSMTNEIRKKIGLVMRHVLWSGTTTLS
jgi:hypothetical protein